MGRLWPLIMSKFFCLYCFAGGKAGSCVRSYILARTHIESGRGGRGGGVWELVVTLESQALEAGGMWLLMSKQ